MILTGWVIGLILFFSFSKIMIVYGEWYDTKYLPKKQAKELADAEPIIQKIMELEDTTHERAVSRYLYNKDYWNVRTKEQKVNLFVEWFKSYKSKHCAPVNYTMLK